MKNGYLFRFEYFSEINKSLFLQVDNKLKMRQHKRLFNFNLLGQSPLSC